MSRLIDADELIKYIKIWEIGTSISSDQKEFIDCVNNQPTVFDMDKVIEQLDNEADRSSTYFEEYADEIGKSEDDDWYYMGLRRAIEIVKGGGLNE